MAVTAKAYLNGVKKLNDGTIDWDDGAITIKCALVLNTYTPDQDVHDFWDDVVANEVASGSGYTTGGVAITSRVITLDTVNNYIFLDGSDAIWTGASFAAPRYAVVYKSTGTNSTSPLIGYVDFGADVPVTGGTFTISWDPTGILRYTA